MSSTFGHFFRVTTFGESHGGMVGAVVDGCPARLPLTETDIQPQLDRRRPGQTAVTSARSEADRVRIVSGVDQGITLGVPIALLVRNHDARPEDYLRFLEIPRPSHADVTYRAKYGIAAGSGGGRASARETIGRVAAGAIAEKWLRERWGVAIIAWVSGVGGVDAPPDLENVDFDRQAVDRHAVRCPDAATAAAMEAEILAARDAGDSVGGRITCVCRGVPPGWGEPVFDKLTATLAAAQMSIPAARGFEIGSGFSAVRMRGSQHNDMHLMKNGRLGTATNRSGGLQGGISNGEAIVFRVAFKPPATLALTQRTADYAGTPRDLAAVGRHDPCVTPRAVPIVESMAALALADAARQADGNATDDRRGGAGA